MGVIINEIKDSYTILLHKVNEEVIGELDFSSLKSISNSMNEVGQIELTVNKYYRSSIEKERFEYYYYNEIKNERMISLDGAFYVIKNVKEDERNGVKTITAYSKEKKLEKYNISVEDLGFYLQDEDDTLGLFSLDDYMYEETGWRFGHIDNVVKYNEDGSPKMRWQESVDTSWLDFLNQNVSTQFNCYVNFDNVNQVVNLYDMSSVGENLNICLSYDNYIQSLEKESSSSDVITKLKLVGNEEECIISDCTVTGTDYIENYSYFIKNGEMSSELTTALQTYYTITEERNRTWKTLRDNKLAMEEELIVKKNEELVVLTNINVSTTSYNFYLSKAGTENDFNGNYTRLAQEEAEKLQAYSQQRDDLYKEIRLLEEDIALSEESIRNINILCQKKTSTDSNGKLIFTQALLDELKKFTFSDTFTDDSYYDAEEMIKDGEARLEILCKPTRTWDIGVEDFTRRLVTNRFRQHWKGQLGLGDIICLYNEETDEEEFIYLVGYSKDYQGQSLSLTLSNKKESQDVVRYINDWLKIVKANNKLITKSKRLLNAQKYNRINIKRGDVK
jgi:hypothetical protein